MMPARYRPDHKDFGKFILSKDVRDVSEEAAAEVVAAARRIAAPHSKTGNYMRGFRRVLGGVTKVGGNPRATTDVVNDDPAAIPNEIGNKNLKARHVLARAGATVGELRGAQIGD